VAAALGEGNGERKMDWDLEAQVNWGLFVIWQQSDVKYVALRRSIFENEYCRSTSTNGFRRGTNNAEG
jgi:hypothetical protein